MQKPQRFQIPFGDPYPCGCYEFQTFFILDTLSEVCFLSCDEDGELLFP